MAPTLTQPKFSSKSRHINNKGWLIVAGIICLLLGLLIWSFLQNYERVLDNPRYSLMPQATANRFLASERLLQAEHKNVHISKGDQANITLDNVWKQPSDEAKQNAVMLYAVSNSQEVNIPKILKWVENGGHLVTFSQGIEEEENELLNELGVHQEWNERVEKAQEVESDANKPASDPDSSTAGTSPPQKILLDEKVVMRLPSLKDNKTDPNALVESVINLNNGTHLDSKKFWQKYPKSQKWADYNWLNKDNQLVAPAQTVLSPTEQQQLLTYINDKAKKFNLSLKADDVMLDVKLGEGRITVLNSKDIFTNPSSYDLPTLAKRSTISSDPTHSQLWQLLQSNEVAEGNTNIASLDNAYLLKYLMADRQQIWLVPDIDVPTLPVMLWRSAKWACVAFLLLLAVGMLALPKRFGRIRHYQTDSERNIFGYFDHVGQYLWHTDEAKALVTQNRTRLIEQIIAKQPQLARLEPDELCQAISEQLNIGKSAVKQGLYNDWQNAEQFLQCTRQFAVIRQAYS